MNPLPFPPGIHNSCPFEVGQMSGYLGLVRPDYLHKETYAHFVVPHEVQETQPGSIRQRAKERFDIESAVLCHNNSILAHFDRYALTYL
jgi:hypothetical protein